MSVAAAYRLSMPTTFALTAGAKTVLLAIAPAGHGLALVNWGVSFDGVTGSAVPGVVEVVQSTGATAGTPGTAPNITQVRGRASGGSAPTAGAAYTAEPTVLTVIQSLFLAQFMGLYDKDLPLGREWETDSLGGTVRAIGIRVNASANVNIRAWLEVEAIG